MCQRFFCRDLFNKQTLQMNIVLERLTNVYRKCLFYSIEICKTWNFFKVMPEMTLIENY